MCYFYGLKKKIILFIYLFFKKIILKHCLGTSLAAQGLRLRCPMQGAQVQLLVRELRSHMPHGQKTKTYSRSNIVTNSVKTLKVVYI